tara:strand:- start:204 stop:533 length:330 start_codon:yes stop_codon:yes gene_type:complete
MTKEKIYRFIALFFNLTVIVFVFFMVLPRVVPVEGSEGFVLWPSGQDIVGTLYGEFIDNLFDTVDFVSPGTPQEILDWSHKILGYGLIFLVYRYRNECGRVVQDIVEKF